MKSHSRYTIILLLILTLALVALSPIVSGQRSQKSNPRKSSEPNQPSPEALEKLRQLAAKQKTFQVGYSPAMDRKLTQLSGIEIPRGTVKQALQVRQKAKAALAKSIKNREQYYKEHPNEFFESRDVYQEIKNNLQKAYPGQQIPSEPQGMVRFLPTFNWFDQNVQRPIVKNQGSCNSCWAFATLSAFEWSFHIQRKRLAVLYGEYGETLPSGERAKTALVTPKYNLNFSEQKMINCVGRDNSCGGGWHGSAFNHLVEYGAPFPWDSPSDSNQLEYMGKDGTCKGLKVNQGFQALTWDYVNYPPDKIPTVMQLKTALLEHGPLVVLVRITEAFQAYQGGVFNEHAPGEINHAVVLIGWDDAKRAWLIQNSWGEEWGEKIKFGLSETVTGGFMWITWDSNSIGKYAAWVDAAMDYPWSKK